MSFIEVTPAAFRFQKMMINAERIELVIELNVGCRIVMIGQGESWDVLDSYSQVRRAIAESQRMDRGDPSDDSEGE